MQCPHLLWDKHIEQPKLNHRSDSAVGHKTFGAHKFSHKLWTSHFLCRKLGSVWGFPCLRSGWDWVTGPCYTSIGHHFLRKLSLFFGHPNQVFNSTFPPTPCKNHPTPSASFFVPLTRPSSSFWGRRYTCWIWSRCRGSHPKGLLRNHLG